MLIGFLDGARRAAATAAVPTENRSKKTFHIGSTHFEMHLQILKKKYSQLVVDLSRGVCAN